MRQVFISYSSQETTQAYSLVHILENMGISCWIAPRDIPIGSDYIDQIPEGINECPCFLVLLSPKSQASQWVRMELSQAVDERKCIFPLLLEDFSVSRGFKFLLRNTQIRPYFNDRNATLQEIITRILDQSGQVQTSPAGPFVTTKKSSGEIYRSALAFFDAGNYSQAAANFQIAADMDHPGAQNMLGYCYDTGKGIIQNYDNAVIWYRKAINNGNIPARRHLGYCYEFGRGVKTNLAEARKWYESARDLGDVKAVEHLKRLEATNTKTADTSADDTTENDQSSALSAEELYKIGDKYYYAENYEEAVKWYRQSADLGYGPAQGDLGFCYENGLGVSENNRLAVYWYLKAAAQEDSDAQYNLAECYRYGNGVEQNLEEAIKWYRKAAAHNDEDAKEALAQLNRFFA